MYVITLITRKATSVEALLSQLNELAPAVPFTALRDDELQGAFSSPDEVFTAFSLAVRNQNYWVGIGVGELKVPRLAGALGAVSTADCSGDALAYSRQAIETARSGAPARGVAVCAEDQEKATALTGILRLLHRIISTRSATENRVIDLLTPGVRGQLGAIAQTLGITSQAVSKTLIRAAWHEEYASREAVYRMLKQLDTGLL